MPANESVQRIEVREAFLKAGRSVFDKGPPLPFEDYADPLIEHGGPPSWSLPEL
jgi:hypothetical protein